MALSPSQRGRMEECFYLLDKLFAENKQNTQQATDLYNEAMALSILDDGICEVDADGTPWFSDGTCVDDYLPF